MDENTWPTVLTWLRRTPGAYWVLAGTCAVLLYILGDVTPVRYEAFGNGYDEDLLFLRLGDLGILLTAAAPLIALRVPVAGAVAAAGLPMALALVADNHAWPFTAFLGLLAVAVCVQWRSQRVAVGIAGLAMLLPVSLQFGGWMWVPGSAQIDLTGGAVSDNLITFGLYLVAVLLVLGAGTLFRRRVSGAIAGRQALARAGEVEGQAAVVAERSRLARDLHDVVAHHVSLIAVRAETAPYSHPDLEQPARTVLAEIAADARLALDELRGVLGILGRADDPARAPQPTWQDVAALVERTGSSGVEVSLNQDLGTAPIGPGVGYAAYRVVQEALTNARRHAPGQPLTVLVSSTTDVLVVRVSNPLPATTAVADGGRGLIGMRERVEALGGRMSAGPVGDEFTVVVTLPLAAG